MTGSEFYAYVLKKFKRTDKETEAYQATTDVIADIRLKIKSEDYKEEAYIAGISSLGDYRISLPTDFGHLIGEISMSDTADDSNYGTLSKISKQKYDELYGARVLTDYTDGAPIHYCIYAKQIYLGPVPDKITYQYQINYTTEAYTEVASGTDPVPFSEKYRNILRAGVLGELHDGLENYQEAGYWKALYISGVGDIKRNDSENISDNEQVKYNGI